MLTRLIMIILQHLQIVHHYEANIMLLVNDRSIFLKKEKTVSYLQTEKEDLVETEFEKTAEGTSN